MDFLRKLFGGVAARVNPVPRVVQELQRQAPAPTPANTPRIDINALKVALANDAAKRRNQPRINVGVATPQNIRVGNTVVMPSGSAVSGNGYRPPSNVQKIKAGGKAVAKGFADSSEQFGNFVAATPANPGIKPQDIIEAQARKIKDPNLQAQFREMAYKSLLDRSGIGLNDSKATIGRKAVGSIGGNIAGFAPIGLATKGLKGAQIAKQIGKGSAIGATAGAGTALTRDNPSLKNVAKSAVGGALVGGALVGVAPVARAGNKAVQNRVPVLPTELGSIGKNPKAKNSQNQVGRADPKQTKSSQVQAIQKLLKSEVNKSQDGLSVSPAGRLQQMSAEGQLTQQPKLSSALEGRSLGGHSTIEPLNPATGVKIDRTQLSGKALSLSNKELEMGQALGLTPEQVASAKAGGNYTEPKTRRNQMDRILQNEEQVDLRTQTRRLQGELSNRLGKRNPAVASLNDELELLDLSKSRTTPLARQLPGKKEPSSFGESISQLEEEIKGHHSYPIEKKATWLDYLRTPEHVLKKFGLDQEAKALNKANHEYKLELPKRIDQISAWYDRVGRSPEASKRIFQYLDGQKGAKLAGEELKVATEIKQYFSEFADRLNLPEDKRISNYITHIFDESLVMKEFDPDLEKLIADKVPGSVYDPFTQQRLGAQGYKEDAFQALDAYTKRGVRKVHMDGALEKLSYAAQGLDESGWNYVKRYGDRINMRPMEIDKLMDNFIKNTGVGYKLGQRPVAKVSQGIRRATYRATLGLNIGSATRNLTQGVNTFTELGTKYTGIGYTKVFQAFANRSDELNRVGVLDNSFIEDRALSAVKQNMQKLDKGLFKMFETAEQINRGAAYFGAKSKALKEGRSLQEAIEEGVRVARKTQFTFGAVDTPVWLQGDIPKLFTQLQSYNVKQAEFVTNMINDKEFIKLTRYIGSTVAVYGLMANALGYKPQDMLPFGSNVTEGKLPIGTTPIFNAVDDARRLAVGKGDKAKQAKTTISSFLGALVPGYSQGKKSLGGIKAVNEGGFDKYGAGHVSLDKTKGNYVKAGIFGKYSLKGKTAKDNPEEPKQPAKVEKATDPDPQNRWNNFTEKAREAIAERDPKQYTDKESKRVDQLVKEGKLTESQAFKKRRDIQKVSISSQYDRDIREAYKLDQTDFNAYVAQMSPEKLEKLRELDKRMVEAKLVAKSKFPKAKKVAVKKARVARARTGVKKKSKGSGVRRGKVQEVKAVQATKIGLPRIRAQRISARAVPKLKARRIAKPKGVKISGRKARRIKI